MTKTVTYIAHGIEWQNPIGKPQQVRIEMPLALKARIFMNEPGAETAFDHHMDSMIAALHGETPKSYGCNCLDDTPLFLFGDDGHGNPTGWI